MEDRSTGMSWIAVLFVILRRPDHPCILRLQRQRQHLSNFFRFGNSSGPSGRVTGGAGAPPFNFERRVL